MTKPTVPAPVESDYVTQVDRWHQERVDRLGAEDGWLTLVGLSWLAPGENRVGRGEPNEVAYDGFPASEVGRFTLDRDVIRFEAASGATVEGLPEDGVITSDADGAAPTILTVGTCTMYVISRGERLGVRIKDRSAPRRGRFAGVERFPVDSVWRIEASYEPAAADARVPVELIIGTVSDEPIAGRAVFELDGERRRLVLMPTDEADRFFVVFGDTTNGQTTYGGGRFLEARRTPDDTVVLDFNRAYNPPCAFTPFATCPMPMEENRLSLPVPAGELKPQDH